METKSRADRFPWDTVPALCMTLGKNISNLCIILQGYCRTRALYNYAALQNNVQSFIFTLYCWMGALCNHMPRFKVCPELQGFVELFWLFFPRVGKYTFHVRMLSHIDYRLRNDNEETYPLPKLSCRRPMWSYIQICMLWVRPLACEDSWCTRCWPVHTPLLQSIGRCIFEDWKRRE